MKVRWDQRAMAALGVVYVVMFYAMVRGHLEEADVGATAVVYALLIAVPQLARRKDVFVVLCAVVAFLILVGGAVLAIAGLYLLWPAALPLALAPIRIPRRWTLVATPIILSITTVLLALGAYVASGPARSF